MCRQLPLQSIGPCLAVLLAGCATSMPTLTTGAIGGLGSQVAEAPTEVYRRIAARAARCWFGPTGTLSATHIFHADAQSPVVGGAVEIALHKLTGNKKKPWGARAYVIRLHGSGTTTLDFTNISLERTLADAVQRDALRWANGQSVCGAQTAPAGPPAIVETTKKT